MGTLPADVVRLPDGRVMTRSRAFALGFVGEKGGLTDKAKALESRRVPLPYRDAPDVDDLGTDTDQKRVESGDKPKRRRRAPEPLKPANVDAQGVKITDDETLAKIAKRTAEIEARRAALAEGIDDEDES